MQKGPSQKARGVSNEQVGGIRSAGNGVTSAMGRLCQQAWGVRLASQVSRQGVMPAGWGGEGGLQVRKKGSGQQLWD